MKTFSISQFARQFGLSRSALLYYDRIGLLPPSGRLGSGYRFYTARDQRRLKRIRELREAGLTLVEIRTCLAAGGRPHAGLLQRRISETSEAMIDLKNRQRLLAAMLSPVGSPGGWRAVDKQMWMEMLQAAGMGDGGMARWHAEFEQRAPEAHREFLLSLGIPEREVGRIREWSAKLPALRSR